ncbi:SPASM domain-containing protein [Streptomyces litchfieldiae]|uniref:SPASM domain-containing protein n=1 Tax=Streptomyces litchfieldiae TaxID=3075543 RepID=A0ABU2MWG9_9ACTN|nr:SPASM domain-containing protein [Streptomyces sp. DSM 44938]MDT0345850.1 SPASM domain-containing protein [Streptomyces sp. DSM 44938]
MDLEALGVTRIGADHVRPFGRGAQDQAPDPAGLCGRCGDGRAAIGPNGEVSPCVLSGWMTVGNVHDDPLATILGGTAMTSASATIRTSARAERKCRPDKEKCYPDQTPCYPAQGPCAPDQAPPTPCSPMNQCNPGYETDKCFPDGY